MNVLEVVLVPTPILDYIRCIGPAISSAQDKVQPHLPRSAYPQEPIPVEDELGGGESGTFGRITLFNHNLYECYVSPYVTSQRVLAERDGIFNWQPLPEGFFPSGAVSTPSLLVYGTPTMLH